VRDARLKVEGTSYGEVPPWQEAANQIRARVRALGKLSQR